MPRGCIACTGDRLRQRRGQDGPPAQMGDPSAIRRLLRRQGQRVLSSSRARRNDQAGRSRHQSKSGNRCRRRRCDRRLDAIGPGVAREGRAARQHCANLPAIRNDADLPQGIRRHIAGRPARAHARRLVRRERVSLPRLDGQARLRNRRRPRRRQHGQAGIQREPAVAQAGGLHLDHDLQRILDVDRGRHEAASADQFQI